MHVYKHEKCKTNIHLKKKSFAHEEAPRLGIEKLVLKYRHCRGQNYKVSFVLDTAVFRDVCCEPCRFARQDLVLLMLITIIAAQIDFKIVIFCCCTGVCFTINLRRSLKRT